MTHYKSGDKIQLVKDYKISEETVEEVGQQLRTTRLGTFPQPAIKVLDTWYFADSGYAVDDSVLSTGYLKT